MDWQAHRREAHALGRTQEFLKQITYGGNDGIVTTFAIVAGFAGAAADGVAQIGGMAVLVFGLANLFADAVSMGLGEFLSTRSQHDLFHSRRAAELREIAIDPEQEREELAHILHQRGLPRDDAEAATEILMRNPPMMADLMMTYEFGMMDPEGDNPAVNGFFTFLAFVIFGSVPLIPYFLLPPEETAFRLSLGGSGLALVALGLLRWNATGERALRCVAETVAVGGTCAAVAYLVGWLVGG
jgi:VIT1/CCC1 family predicted Fe2+/Mn2+ transporter